MLHVSGNYCFDMFSQLNPMLFGARVLVCGSVCLAAALAREPEPDSLPPIFAMPVKVATVSPKAEVRHSLVSDRVHRLITHAVLANDSYFAQSSEGLSTEGATDSSHSDALLMEKFVVRSPSLQEFELPKAMSPRQRFQTQGIFYESIRRKFTFEAMVYVDRWYSNRQGSGGTETRAELKFNFRW